MVNSASSILQLLNSIGKTKISYLFDTIKDVIPNTNEFKDIPITQEMREKMIALFSSNEDASGELLVTILTSKTNGLDLLKDLSSKNISRDMLTLIVNILRNKEEIIRIIVNEDIKKFIDDLGTNLNTLRNLSYKKEVDNLINDYRNGTFSINSIKPLGNGIKSDALQFLSTMSPYIGKLFQSARKDPVDFTNYIIQEIAKNYTNSTNQKKTRSTASTKNINEGKLLKRNKHIISMRDVSDDDDRDKPFIVLLIVLLILIHIDTKKSIENFYNLIAELENTEDISGAILMNNILGVPKSLTDLFNQLFSDDKTIALRETLRENTFITSMIGSINEKETAKDIITRLFRKTCIYINDFNNNKMSDIELLPNDEFTLKKIDFAPLNDILNITPKFQEITELNENSENGLYIVIYNKVNADADAVKEEIRQYIFINRNSNLKDVIHFQIKSLYYALSAFSCVMKDLTSIKEAITKLNSEDISSKYTIGNIGNIEKGDDAVRNKKIDNFNIYGRNLISLKSSNSYTAQDQEYIEAEEKFNKAQVILYCYDIINGDFKKIIYYLEKLLRNITIVIIPVFMTILLDTSVNSKYDIEYINTLFNITISEEDFLSESNISSEDGKIMHILEGNYYKMITNDQVSYFSFINNNYDNAYAETIFSGNNAKFNTITCKDKDGTNKTININSQYESSILVHKLVNIQTEGFTVNYDENYIIIKNYSYGENTTIEPCYPITLDKGSYVNINNNNEQFTIDENNILTILNNNYKLDGNTYDIKTIFYFISYNIYFNTLQIVKASKQFFDNTIDKLLNKTIDDSPSANSKANIDEIDFIKTYNEVYTKKTYFLDLSVDNYSNNENIFLPYQMTFISYKDATFVDIISGKVYKKESTKINDDATAQVNQSNTGNNTQVSIDDSSSKIETITQDKEDSDQNTESANNVDDTKNVAENQESTNGQYTETEAYDEDGNGNVNYKIVTTYDKDGNKISAIITYDKDDDGIPDSRDKITYDEDGNIKMYENTYTNPDFKDGDDAVDDAVDYKNIRIEDYSLMNMIAIEVERVKNYFKNDEIYKSLDKSLDKSLGNMDSSTLYNELVNNWSFSIDTDSTKKYKLLVNKTYEMDAYFYFSTFPEYTPNAEESNSYNITFHSK